MEKTQPKSDVGGRRASATSSQSDDSEDSANISSIVLIDTPRKVSPSAGSSLDRKDVSSVGNWIGWRPSLTNLAKRFCSLRVILSLIFQLSLTILGIMMFVMSLSYQIRQVRDAKVERSKLVRFFVTEYVNHWLGLGPSLVDGLLEFVRYQEAMYPEEFEFENHGEMVSKLHVHLRSQASLYQEMGVTGLGCGTDTGVASLFWVDYLLSVWTNETLMDNPCCNYSDTNQPGQNMVRLPNENNTGFGEYFPISPAPFDFRVIENGWYKSALEKEDHAWTDFLTNVNLLTLTITKSWYTLDGEHKGVCSIWFSLDKFELILENLVEKFGIGKFFVLDTKEGYLIATSSGAEIYTRVQEGDVEGKVLRINPEECEDDVISNVWKAVKRKFGSNLGDLDQKLGSSGKLISTSIGSQMVAVYPLNFTGYELLIVHTSSLWDSVGDAISMCIVQTVVAGFFILCCTVFVFDVVFFLMKPLFKLVKELKKVEKMDLDLVNIDRLSFFYEVSVLQKSFLFMIEKLRSFRGFLPLNIFEEDCESDHSSETSSTVSDSTDSTHSSDSSGTYFSDSLKSLICSPSFDVYLHSKFVYVVCIFWKFGEIMGKKKEVLQFSKFFFEELVKTTKRFHGIATEYSLTKTLVQFDLVSSAINFSLEMKLFVERMDHILKCVMKAVIHGFNALSGNVGCIDVKKRTSYSPEMDIFDEMKEDIIDCVSHQIFLTRECNPTNHKRFSIIPFNVMYSSFLKRTFALFTVKYVEKYDGEWMYEIYNNQEENAEKSQLLIDCFDFLLDGEIEDCLATLSELESWKGFREVFRKKSLTSPTN